VSGEGEKGRGRTACAEEGTKREEGVGDARVADATVGSERGTT
jgi:hypothetical protein